MITIVAAPIVGSLRPRQDEGLYEGQFWSQKLSWHNCADMVIAGDSRTFLGVSPARMNKVMTDLTILNFGFQANCYTREYLDATENVLRKDGQQKTIVLGINPHSLQASLAQTGGYYMYCQKSTINNLLDIHLPFIRHATANTTIDIMLESLDSRPRKVTYYSKFHADGWNAYNRIPRAEVGPLEQYRQIFADEKISPAIIENILSFTRKWTAQKIRVFGFRQPCSAEMLELENQISGFDQQKFVVDFEAAGGVWLDLEQTGYEDYDHVHLSPQGALEFSHDLAVTINNMHD